MGSIEERKIGAILGAAVADAAAQPLHWIYDLGKLDALVKDRDDVEFFIPSANPYYLIETGKQTCYGDQAYVLLNSLVKKQGLDSSDLKERTYAFFGPNSEYESDVVKEYTWKGEIKKEYPVKNPWRHFSIKTFLKNADEGNDITGDEYDEQIDCVAKIVPLVALYAGHVHLLEKAEDAIRLTQNSDFTVAIGLAVVRLLEQYILYGANVDALGNVVKDLRDHKRRSPTDLDCAVAGLLRQVQRVLSNPHRDVSSTIFRND